MNILDVIHAEAEELAAIAEIPACVRPLPFKCDSFVARSAMQKAIRRGLSDIALRAAATVMLTDSGIVWRRLLVTALEDLGIHETRLLVKIAAAIERRRFGIKLNDEWPLIQKLIVECCAATRCQAANDLHNLALHHPRYEQFRASTRDLNVRDLLAMTADEGRDLIERDIAVLSCLGSQHAPWSVGGPPLEPERLIAAVGDKLHASLPAIYGWALRKSQLPLATSALLLMAANRGHCARPSAIDDDVPPINFIDGIPSFALDQYTLVGRAAIRNFTDVSQKWRQFASDLGITKSQQIRAAGELVFRLEGAAVTRRASWDIARMLFGQSRTIGCHLPEEAVEEGLAIIRSELPLLDELRADWLT